MRVKVCGITSVADAATAVSAGADAVGINLVGGPRKVDLATADEVVSALGPMVTPVVLVRLDDGEAVERRMKWAERRRISHLQLYGGVTPEAIRRLAGEGFRPMVPAAVRSSGFAEEVEALLDACGEASPAAILLDAFEPDKAGGTGRTFHWDWVREAREAGRLDGWPPIVVAGGLRSDNVAEAIRQTRPYAVDVAGGVESAPGRKDPAKMRAFVTAAREAFQEIQAL